MIFLQIIFWLCVLLVFHSYVLYPLILQLKSKKDKFSNNQVETDLPYVSILMSAYNEELVIKDKIESIMQSEYPSNKFEIIIGSDNSSDNTNTIIEQLSKDIPCIKFFPFNKRQGKSNIINQLVEHAKGSILILTDANVMFDKATISELILPYSDSSIGLVDSHMKNTGIKKHGISIQEKSYISREVRIKHFESMHWGSMMGPFGGCFSIRKSLFMPVPINFLVDDFFICMNILKQGYKAINNLDAHVFEDVSNDLSIEFRRKIRISTGNFQNLMKFKSILWPPFTGIAFSFFSHKVLRWISPIFLIIALGTLIPLAISIKLYLVLLILYTISIIIPFTDFLLRKIQIHNILLRFITHFYSMNLALLIGMFKAIKGVQNNVWTPTQRFQ